MDVVDWEAVRHATIDEVAETIKQRGMNNVIAGKIKDFLNKVAEEHGSPDLEWLRDVPLEEAKYLLHYHLITFGKVFSTKKKANCNACPMRGECKYFASVFASYELPDDHPILDEMDRRDPDDPSPYLFAVWNEGKHRSSISHTSSSGKQVHYKIVCNCSEPDCESLVCGTQHF
ncbi:hypothetical protein OROMI_009696 [Orobanche minor]